MPRTSASPSDRKLIFDVNEPPYWAPGARTSREATPLVWLSETACCAAPRMSEKLKPNLANTAAVMSAAPLISKTALMICTQVVPFIPPTRT